MCKNIEILSITCIDMIEIFASHSTPSFIFGWKQSKKPVEIEISRLKDENFKSFATCLQIK